VMIIASINIAIFLLTTKIIPWVRPEFSLF
jgi:hypothetical protein